MLENYPIEFRGSVFTFLVLYIKNNTIDVVKKAIYKKIQSAPEFFKNASIILNVSFLNSSVNWNDMQYAIRSTGLRIIGISGYIDSILKKIIMRSGFPIFPEGKNFLNNINYIDKNNSLKYKKLQSKIITTPVRSGQKIYVNHSDLIVINNVSTGAELIAGGNIHVYGAMRGRALAGVHGDKTRNIFCTKFFAEIVSIAGEYLLFDQISDDLLGNGVHIFLKNHVVYAHLLI
ncbi:septum site-determining protein MinC [Buchnera aphidicola]|uniref:Probable septum site-determining protein MinC n=1 Tax=Buchnera aphidicola (Sarucallis kahawaluokalani) TaxID=1241878 RepID=A0A4D6YM05_9GAMM|nr:septum site-determining protein MinC [Buchnera aphidicola]QCI26025.1 septum site-determining protein MinC [Buchnera aphidicola (Sarucallis kahawaluokalani)]